MDFIIFINYCVLSGEPRHLHIVPSRTGALLLAHAQPGGEAACQQDVLHAPAAPRADTPGYGPCSNMQEANQPHNIEIIPRWDF